LAYAFLKLYIRYYIILYYDSLKLYIAYYIILVLKKKHEIISSTCIFWVNNKEAVASSPFNKMKTISIKCILFNFFLVQLYITHPDPTLPPNCQISVNWKD